MTHITKVILFFFALLLAVGVRAENTETKVECVTDGVDLTTDVDYVITSTEPFATTGSVNIANTEHAVVILQNIKPSKVVSDYLSHILINGEAAVSEENCQVRMYAQGAIVFPYGGDFKPLTCYTQENYDGDSCDDYDLSNTGGYMNTMTETTLDNRVRSFKLKRGYMVTFATGISGWGYSRCFIADQADLEISSVPEPLNGRISSYRVFKWFNAQKKGLASDTNASTNAILGTSWCYQWDVGWDMTPDVECVPNHPYEDYPTSSECGKVTYSCHLKTNNEPGNSSDNHPQDVETILDNWQNLMRTGLRLCSETSHDGSWNHLKAFIDSIDARGWRCDLLDLHCYWTGFSSLTWYSDYYGNGRPIWISEWLWGSSWGNAGIFAPAPDGSAAFSEANQQTNLNGTVPILETLNSNPRVERYAYWNSEWTCSKLYAYSYGLSLLGEYYAEMESGLGYDASQEFVPKIVYRSPSELSGSYTRREGIYELSWSDPNGDMIDSLLVECKLPGTSKWAKIASMRSKENSSASGAAYSYTDTIQDPGIYYYRVTEYYNGGKGKFTTNEVNVSISTSNSVGALQYGRINVATNVAVSTEIKEQETAPYVVMGMLSNKNSSNGITSQVNSLAKASFKFRLYPWTLPAPVDISGAETVDYLVLPPDTVCHLSDDMTLISQKIGNVKGDEVQVLFPEAFPEGVTPVVVAQQNTSITAYAPVTVKVYDITNTGFSVKLVRQEGETTTFGPENVNYFACTPGQIAIGEGKLLTVGRDSDTPCGGSARQTVYFKNAEGDTLHLENPYIIAAPQTNNYEVTSVFRQHSTMSDDDGNVYAASIRRQVDQTTTVTTTNKATDNGDYIGWFIISDDPDGTDNMEPLIVPTAIDEVSDRKGFNVYCMDSCLWTDNSALRAYNTAGVQVPFGVELPAGVYIVTDGRESEKILCSHE